jgi:cell division protein FtsB
MREFQQRHTLKKLLYSRFALVLLGLICILMLRSIVELYGKYQKIADLKNQAQKEESTLQDKVTKAQAKDDALHTERGIEDYVRRTYPMVKEGEGVIVVYDASTSPVVEVRKDISLSERITLWFVKILQK